MGTGAAREGLLTLCKFQCTLRRHRRTQSAVEAGPNHRGRIQNVWPKPRNAIELLPKSNRECNARSKPQLQQWETCNVVDDWHRHGQDPNCSSSKSFPAPPQSSQSQEGDCDPPRSRIARERPAPVQHQLRTIQFGQANRIDDDWPDRQCTLLVQTQTGRRCDCGWSRLPLD